MTTKDTEAFDTLRDAVIESLVSTGYWGSHQDVQRKIADKAEALRAGAAPFRSDDDEDSNAIFLAIGLPHLARFDDGSDIDAVSWHCGDICWSMRSLEPHPLGARLHEPVRSAVEAAIACLCRSCCDAPVADPIRFRPPLLVILSDVLERKVQWSGEPLFESLFEGWLADLTAPPTSAALLLFLHAIRAGDQFDTIFRHPRVLDAAFDRELCRRHWNVGADAIAVVNSSGFVQTLFDELVVE